MLSLYVRYYCHILQKKYTYSSLFRNLQLFSGMHHSLRCVSRRNSRNTGNCSLHAMQGSKNGRFSFFEYGQNYHSCQCSHMWNDFRSRYHFHRSIKKEIKENTRTESTEIRSKTYDSHIRFTCKLLYHAG